MILQNNYLESTRKQFEYYKLLGDKTFEQLTEEQLFKFYDDQSNSIVVIVQHIYGNMMSRWTDMLSTDGEKKWRNREQEFDLYISSKEEMLQIWEKGWACLFQTFDTIQVQDFDELVYIRNMGHTLVEAINRSLAHYAYHIGQIVFIGKTTAEKWESLSIPKGQSETYNQEKFRQDKRRGHFTDDFLSDTSKT